MSIVSVDLAYKNWRDIGIAVLRSHIDHIDVEFIRHEPGVPSPLSVANFLDGLARAKSSRILLLDGPQGWKQPSSDLPHSRRCERALNTPAKTGLRGVVKPANYLAFVRFSIAV